METLIYEQGSVWGLKEERKEEKCLDRRGKTNPRKRTVDGVSAFTGSAVEHIANCEIAFWRLSIGTGPRCI